MGQFSEADNVQGYFGKSMGWALAAPDGEGPDPNHATHSETAASLFDVVFLTVALVAYSPALRVQPTSPRTSTHRSNVAPGGFLVGQPEGTHDLYRTFMSSSIQFQRATSQTGTIAERIWLGSLSASAPEHSARSQLCSAEPLRIPTIMIRGWTSRFA